MSLQVILSDLAILRNYFVSQLRYKIVLCSSEDNMNLGTQAKSVISVPRVNSDQAVLK